MMNYIKISIIVLIYNISFYYRDGRLQLKTDCYFIELRRRKQNFKMCNYVCTSLNLYCKLFCIFISFKLPAIPDSKESWQFSNTKIPGLKFLEHQNFGYNILFIFYTKCITNLVLSPYYFLFIVLMLSWYK
jgi:hypothetical protein